MCQPRKEQRTRVKKVAYWDALPFGALREEPKTLAEALNGLRDLKRLGTAGYVTMPSTKSSSRMRSQECWNMGMRSAYFNSADFHGRRERLIREAPTVQGLVERKK